MNTWTTLKRVFVSGAKHFVRSGVVSAATVLVMTVTLAIIGSMIFVSAILSSTLHAIEDKVDVNVYFVTDADQADNRMETLSAALQPFATNLTINGNGYTLDGASAYQGFQITGGTVLLENLTIQHAVAQGAAGGGGNGNSTGGGGAAGLGGGLFVGSGANVTLSNTIFSSNQALGGAGSNGATSGGSAGGANGGGLYGGSIRITPAPGFEIELGARHSNISLLQGELGGETSAGISLNVGFGGDPRVSRFSLW